LIVNDNAFVALPPPLSTNRTVKAAVPVAAGVPLMTPVGAATFKPCGNVPCEIDHVTGETAPVTARVAEYGEPAVPFGNAAVVITGFELTVICRICSSVSPAPSSTFAVNWGFPLLVGVPLMVPPLSSESPAGSAPPDTDHT
jgi:hypothetical protein